MKEVIPNSPSIRTIDYMQRRMRRELKRIGDENPDLYALIASNMLIKWDSLIDKKSYLPAYVLEEANLIWIEVKEVGGIYSLRALRAVFMNSA